MYQKAAMIIASVILYFPPHYSTPPELPVQQTEEVTPLASLSNYLNHQEMNLKSTHTQSLILSALAIFVVPLVGKSQNISQHIFNSTPALISGTANQMSARYLFTNVCVGVDAIVTKVGYTSVAMQDLPEANSNHCGAYSAANSSTSCLKSIYFKKSVYPAINTLPVKYHAFDVDYCNNQIMLKWVTSEEANHHHFEVERSFNQQDFKPLALILGGFDAGMGRMKYELKDAAIELKSNSMAYYRLKQVDLDGRYSYSKVIAVRLEETGILQMQLSPNPFAETILIGYQSIEAGIAEIRLVNLNGKTIVSKHSAISKGSNHLQLTGLSKLAPGIYVASLIINGVVVDNQKLVKH